MKLFLIPLHLRMNYFCVLVCRNRGTFKADTLNSVIIVARGQFQDQKGNWRRPIKALHREFHNGWWARSHYTHWCAQQELSPSTWKRRGAGKQELIAHLARKPCPSLWKGGERWMKFLSSLHNTKLLTQINGWKCGQGLTDQKDPEIGSGISLQVNIRQLDF